MNDGRKAAPSRRPPSPAARPAPRGQSPLVAGHDLIAVQRLAGNRAVAGALARTVQRKLQHDGSWSGYLQFTWASGAYDVWTKISGQFDTLKAIVDELDGKVHQEDDDLKKAYTALKKFVETWDFEMGGQKVSFTDKASHSGFGENLTKAQKLQASVAVRAQVRAHYGEIVALRQKLRDVDREAFQADMQAISKYVAKTVQEAEADFDPDALPGIMVEVNKIVSAALLRRQGPMLARLKDRLEAALRRVRAVGNYKKNGLEAIAGALGVAVPAVGKAVAGGVPVAEATLREWTTTADDAERQVADLTPKPVSDQPSAAVTPAPKPKQPEDVYGLFAPLAANYAQAMKFPDYCPSKLADLRDKTMGEGVVDDKEARRAKNELEKLLTAILAKKDALAEVMIDLPKAEAVTRFTPPDLTETRDELPNRGQPNTWTAQFERLAAMVEKVLAFDARMAQIAVGAAALTDVANRTAITDQLREFAESDFNEKSDADLDRCQVELERRQLVEKDVAAPVTSRNGDTVERKHVDDCPGDAAHHQVIRNTLAAIKGGKANPWRGTWGDVHGNAEGNLPSGTTYLEYYVKKTKNQGTGDGYNRIVRGADGKAYYSWTHYGLKGEPPFVLIDG